MRGRVHAAGGARAGGGAGRVAGWAEQPRADQAGGGVAAGRRGQDREPPRPRPRTRPQREPGGRPRHHRPRGHQHRQPLLRQLQAGQQEPGRGRI